MKMAARAGSILGLALGAMLSFAGHVGATDCAGPHQATCLLDTALAHARASDDRDLRTSALIEIAALHAAAGNRERAKGLFDEAVAGLPGETMPLARFSALRHLARRQAESGFGAEAIAHLREAAATARRAVDEDVPSNRLGWIRSLQTVALALADQGDRESALATAQTVMALLATVDDPVWRHSEFVIFGASAAKHGLRQVADAGFSAAGAEAVRMADVRERLFMLLSVAEGRWKAGHLAEARRDLEALKARAESESSLADRNGLLGLVNLRLYQLTAGTRPE